MDPSRCIQIAKPQAWSKKKKNTPKQPDHTRKKQNKKKQTRTNYVHPHKAISPCKIRIKTAETGGNLPNLATLN